MCFASISVWPSRPILCTRSLPARSTRLTLARRTVSLPCSLRSTCMVNMQCERDDAWFMGVSVMALLVSPRKRRFRASSSLSALCVLTLRIVTFPSSSSRSCTLGRSSSAVVSWSGSSKSYPWSL